MRTQGVQTDSIHADVRANLGQTEYKRALAYRRLGVDPKNVDCFPLLRKELRCISRLASRSLRVPVRALDYLQSSEDPEARKIWRAYLSVPRSYRRLLPAEAFCLAAGVSPFRVLEMITVVAVRLGAPVSRALAAATQCTVLEKMIDGALRPEGAMERLRFLKATGLLPRRETSAGESGVPATASDLDFEASLPIPIKEQPVSAVSFGPGDHTNGPAGTLLTGSHTPAESLSLSEQLRRRRVAWEQSQTDVSRPPR